MRLKGFIYTLIAFAALLSCNSRNEDGPGVDEKDPTLALAIEFPSMTATKGDVGSLAGHDGENEIKSLSVWVFTSDDSHTPVASKSISSEDFPVSGGVRRYSLPVSTAFAENPVNVDVFVLANAASIGCYINADFASVTADTWTALNEASFGKVVENDQVTSDPFGLTPGKIVHIDNPTTTPPTFQNGLPMSGVKKNLVVQGQSPVLRLDAVRLRRAVSRMRFVFCKTKTEGETKTVSIDNVSLNGRQIPVEEYVFTENVYSIVIPTDPDETYDLNPYSFAGPGTAIASNEAPENYIYINQDPTVYQKLIDDAVTADPPLLTDMGYTYFRESDQRLIGRIDYTIIEGSVEKHKTREFSMVSPGDFARNHTWTLLGYFLSKRSMQISISVQPWDYNEYTVDFSNQSVIVTEPFEIEASSAIITAAPQGVTDYDFNVKLKTGEPAVGHLKIIAPSGGRLMIKPSGDTGAFAVSPEYADIKPNDNGGLVTIRVAKNPNYTGPAGKTLSLSFYVVVGSEDSSVRPIDATSEVIDDVYRFEL